MITATFLCLNVLRAQDSSGEAPSADMDSGSDATALPEAPQMPMLQAPTTPEAEQSMEENLYGAGEAEDEAPAEPNAQSRPWKLNYHAGVETRYDSNVFISPNHPQHDVLTDLIASAGLTLGDYTAREDNYLVTDYTGNGELFGRYTSQDAYNQNASVATQLLFGHLKITADFTFEDAAEDNIDIGARTRSKVYTGHGAVRYDISDKTYVEVTGQVTISDYQTYLNSDDERGGASFNYLLDPSVTLGLGATVGVLHVQDSPSQTYEQLLVSMQVDVTDKFTLSASAGGEDRQTSTGGDLYTPVLQLTADYKPFQELDLSLSAFRQLENSAYYAGSDFISTGVSAAAKYALSARFTLMLQGEYENCDYRDVSTGAGISRNDNYLSIRPAFRYTASSNCSVDLYYFYRDNESTYATSSFTDTQVGVDFTFTY